VRTHEAANSQLIFATSFLGLQNETDGYELGSVE